MSDYSDYLTIHDDAIKRLKETLPRGRWQESIELAVLAEQQLRALVEECKRQKRAKERTDAEVNWHLPIGYRPRYFEDFT